MRRVPQEEAGAESSFRISFRLGVEPKRRNNRLRLFPCRERFLFRILPVCFELEAMVKTFLSIPGFNSIFVVKKLL